MIIDSLLTKYSKVLFFDVETTGLNFEFDDVIEFACILIQTPNIRREFDWLINIGWPLPNSIIEITNITN